VSDVAAMDDLAATAAWLRSVRNDPYKFVMEAFDWESDDLKRSGGPVQWQRDVLEMVRDGLVTPQGAIRICIASGHGVGKSALISWLVLFCMSTRVDCKALVTAASDDQLHDRLRAEIAKWHTRFRAAEFFVVNATSVESVDTNHKFTWRADLRAFNPLRPEVFQGIHNQGSMILIAMDEASAVPDIIYETLEGAMTDADTEILWIAAGNPLRPSGPFYESFDEDSGWRRMHVDSRTISFVNQAQIEEWRKKHGGDDSDFFRKRVKGEFPRLGSSGFISSEAVREATERPLVKEPRWPLILGVDPARYGDDNTVLYARRANDARSWPPLSFNGLNTIQIADEVMRFCNKHGVDVVMIDGIGVGAGVFDILRHNNVNVIDVQFGAKADQGTGEKLGNKRVECWWLMRFGLEHGLCIVDDPQLRDDLVAVEYFYNTAGATMLEPKDALKKRGLPSPDIADALSLTYAYQNFAMPEQHQRGAPGDRLVVHEYDPYSEAAMKGEPYPEAAARVYANEPEREWNPLEQRWV
jgi:hypothetical protein